jgi:hypothetical protein
VELDVHSGLEALAVGERPVGDNQILNVAKFSIGSTYEIYQPASSIQKYYMYFAIAGLAVNIKS